MVWGWRKMIFQKMKKTKNDSFYSGMVIFFPLKVFKYKYLASKKCA